ncbi:MAG: VanZ family protein [Bacillota bacterium]|nr:VanZ family protein [Bacillota bacterium]
MNYSEVLKMRISADKKILISWIMVMLWMALIFNLSAQVREESNQLSTGITVIIEKIIEKVNLFDIKFDIKTINHIVRKNAHFFIYLILGILVMNAIRKSKYLALSICIFYAMSDELHQAFVPGRGPGIKDVLIDSAGAYIGVLIFILIMKKVIKNERILYE